MLSDIRLVGELRDCAWDGTRDLIDGLVVEITTKCDCGACEWCLNHKPGEGADMIPETVVRVVYSLREWLDGRKLEEVWLVGGEPALNSSIGEIFDLFEDVALKITLVTKGVSLANEVLARKLVGDKRLGKIIVMVNNEWEVVTALVLAGIRSELGREGLGIAIGTERVEDENLAVAVGLIEDGLGVRSNDSRVPEGTPRIDILGRLQYDRA